MKGPVTGETSTMAVMAEDWTRSLALAMAMAMALEEDQGL